MIKAPPFRIPFLEALVMKRLAILQMATCNPAEDLRRTDSMGRAAIGHDADLVLLDANPLAKVENLHAIAGVVRAGQMFTAARLVELKQQVAANRGILLRPSLRGGRTRPARLAVRL